jgi:hypothetical protein
MCGYVACVLLPKHIGASTQNKGVVQISAYFWSFLLRLIRTVRPLNLLLQCCCTVVIVVRENDQKRSAQSKTNYLIHS